MQYLKIKLSTLVFESRLIRSKERHTLANARALSGIFSKKHSLGSNLPEMPEKTRRAIEVENAKEKAQEAYENFWGLQHHRKNRVRKEARDTNLAIGFLRGHAYADMERDTYSMPDWDNIERMVLKYGTDGGGKSMSDMKQRYEEWIQGASNHIGATVTEDSRMVGELMTA